MDRLKGKVAFITGAGTGIGRNAAMLFASEGARIVIADFNAELGKESEQLVQAAGGEALFVEMNVTDEDSVRNAVAAGVEKFGKLDVLYNCAGGSVGDDGAITKIEPWVINHTLDLDVKGTLLCCRHAIPELIKAGGGSVINMSSTAALQGTAMHVYSAAKGAILSLTKSLASTYTLDLVRVNAICPGIVLTERVKKRFGDLPDREGGSADSMAGKTATRYPFGVGHAEDIAQVA
ncbi:MAG: SDR family oxidoreductase, partial [Pseudomonadales bacterium]|nr:SDR family oxidoreductase [Pseudomonadales bacterium]